MTYLVSQRGVGEDLDPAALISIVDAAGKIIPGIIDLTGKFIPAKPPPSTGNKRPPSQTSPQQFFPQQQLFPQRTQNTKGMSQGTLLAIGGAAAVALLLVVIANRR